MALSPRNALHTAQLLPARVWLLPLGQGLCSCLSRLSTRVLASPQHKPRWSRAGTPSPLQAAGSPFSS